MPIGNSCQNPECSNILGRRQTKYCSKLCANRTKAKYFPSPFCNPDIQSKAKATVLKKYGVDNVFKLPSFQANIHINKDYKKITPKIVKSCKEKYGEDFYRKKWKKYNQRNIPKDVLDKLENGDWLKSQHEIYCLSEIARQLKVSFTMVWQYARDHGIETRKHTTSQLEHRIAEILDRASISYIKNDRKQLNGKELDFFIPNHNLGIEAHGIYWHSSKFQSPDHLKYKYNLAQNKGIDLIQFTECDLKYKFDIVTSIINCRLNLFETVIYARKCNIRVDLSHTEIENFYNDNHLQGHIPSKVNIALCIENDIISIMSFSMPRFSTHEWELTRYSIKKNHKIIGGASRLFNHFIKTYKPNNIISYSDTQYFTGKLYDRLGFNHVKTTPPNYSYVCHDKLLHRMNFQKKCIQKDFPDADLSLSEEVLVLELYGYHRFYHVGQRVHIWNCSSLN